MGSLQIALARDKSIYSMQIWIKRLQGYYNRKSETRLQNLVCNARVRFTDNLVKAQFLYFQSTLYWAKHEITRWSGRAQLQVSS